MSELRIDIALMAVAAGICPAIAPGLIADASKHEARWPQFRGPESLGVAPEGMSLPVHFGPAENVIWNTELPAGHSSPCVWGERVFLTGFDKEKQKLETFCLDRRDGRILWRRTAPAERIEKVHPISSPATATPTTDGRFVYVYFGSYGLLAYDFEGKEQWQKPLPTPVTRFGTGTSPILSDGLLILQCVGTPGSLIAVACQTGKTVWEKKAPRFGAGYSVPLVRHDQQVTELIVSASNGVTAYELKDGKERWWFGGPYAEAIPTPVIGDGLLFVVAQIPGGDPDDRIKFPAFDDMLQKYDANKDGCLAREEIPNDLVLFHRGSPDGTGDITLAEVFSMIDQNRDGKINRQEWQMASAFTARFEDSLLAIRPGLTGDITKTHLVWKGKGALPEVPSPLYYRGRLYLVKNGGIVSCLNAQTGQMLYRERLGAGGHYYSSPVAGDGKVYAASRAGVMVVIKAGDQFEILARNDLGEPVMATPAVADGKLYVRTERHLYAFGP